MNLLLAFKLLDFNNGEYDVGSNASVMNVDEFDLVIEKRLLQLTNICLNRTCQILYFLSLK